MAHALTVRERIALSGLTRDAVARQAGFHPSQFSRYINGTVKPPPDFKSRTLAALDLLQRAERAADEARRRVIAA